VDARLIAQITALDHELQRKIRDGCGASGVEHLFPRLNTQLSSRITREKAVKHEEAL
jgi:hypothetical protein